MPAKGQSCKQAFLRIIQLPCQLFSAHPFNPLSVFRIKEIEQRTHGEQPFRPRHSAWAHGRARSLAVLPLGLLFPVSPSRSPFLSEAELPFPNPSPVTRNLLSLYSVQQTALHRGSNISINPWSFLSLTKELRETVESLWCLRVQVLRSRDPETHSFLRRKTFVP